MGSGLNFSLVLVCGNEITFSSSKVTAPQDAHGKLMLQVYLGSNTLDICR